MDEMTSAMLGNIKRTPGSSWIYHACVDCGKERWVVLRKGIPRNPRCRNCANHSPSHAKGKPIYKNQQGYVLIRLNPDDFFYPMADIHGYVYEHRLVIAKMINRCLLPWEVIHHKDGIKDHNTPENLSKLPSQKYHIVDSIVKARTKKLESKIAELQTQIRTLTWRIKELEAVKREVFHG